MLRIFFNTGARRAEVADLRWSRIQSESDVNLDRGELRLFGKGRRERMANIDPATIATIDAYLRARSKTNTTASTLQRDRVRLGNGGNGRNESTVSSFRTARSLLRAVSR